MSIYNKLKCVKCKKKTIYTSNCKCNNIFCLNCINMHDCSFNHIIDNKNKLKIENPKIQFEKILKI
jgi:hypothetical protein